MAHKKRLFRLKHHKAAHSSARKTQSAPSPAKQSATSSKPQTTNTQQPTTNRQTDEPIIGNVIDEYNFLASQIPVTVQICTVKNDFIPLYKVNVSVISKHTEIILEQIRKELVKSVRLGAADIAEITRSWAIEEKFSVAIHDLVKKYFPDLNDQQLAFLSTYLTQKALGLGNIELLLSDIQLEEIAINNAHDPVWVYHRKYGWLKTTINIESEEQVRHYATMIGRKVGRQITVLNPLMDATLEGGDRVNATLMPISSGGNTLTIRKFSVTPWTITSMLTNKTMSADAAALIWTAIQYELSMIISGGTASGKTSMLNAISEFFPPNQRIISIEDTRELQLPSFLHWLPMLTRLPNNEGRGEVTMNDLLVNALRQRPDRIIVGEIRRKREAETLFEAIHTGHSVYATLHANTTEETITRLTNPPIDLPRTLLPALSMIVVQYRNRRTGLRRIFEVSEIMPDSNGRVLLAYDAKKDLLKSANKSHEILKTIKTYTGMSDNELRKDLRNKETILKWLVKQRINTVDGVGRVMAEYYTNPERLWKAVRANKPLV